MTTMPDCKMSEEFKIGDDVYVRDPQKYIPGCTCVVGRITDFFECYGKKYARIDASVGKIGGGYDCIFGALVSEIGHRIGTPLSQISGRPGHPGYTEFCRIARSWGYE